MNEGLVSRFWQIDEEEHFTPAETRLFFKLLKLCEKGEFVYSDEEMSRAVGLCLATMRKSRKRLIDVGFISISQGNGRGCKTIYNTGEEKTVEIKSKPKPKPKQKRRDDLFGDIDMRPKREEKNSIDKPQLNDVIVYFERQGQQKGLAELFYYHYDSLGWETSNGAKVKRWQSLANKWIVKDSKNYGNVNEASDDFKRIIAARISEADNIYREKRKHPE